MMEAAVSADDAELGPILINPHPETQEAAEANLFAFSNERRQQNQASGSSDLLQITELPRLRRCYGWIQITGEELWGIVPRRLRPPRIEIDKVKRSIERDANYIAVVYEFVEDVGNDPVVVQPVLDFFWRVGFAYAVTTLARNWKGGVLIDLGDIVHPRGYLWRIRQYGFRTVDQILRRPDLP